MHIYKLSFLFFFFFPFFVILNYLKNVWYWNLRTNTKSTQKKSKKTHKLQHNTLRIRLSPRIKSVEMNTTTKDTYKSNDKPNFLQRIIDSLHISIMIWYCPLEYVGYFVCVFWIYIIPRWLVFELQKPHLAMTCWRTQYNRQWPRRSGSGRSNRSCMMFLVDQTTCRSLFFVLTMTTTTLETGGRRRSARVAYGFGERASWKRS